MASNRYSGELEHKTRAAKSLILLGVFDHDEEKKGLQLHVESCKVNEVAAELMMA
jgi:hypothetical protein